jgi:hypothetical protein
MKLHLAMIKETKDYTRTYTLCGRENSQSDDGTNSTPNHGEVTCGHCLKLMAKPWFKRRVAA